MKKNCANNLFKLIRKLLLMLFLFSFFQYISYAETYRIGRVFENQFELIVNGMNLCWSSNKTYLYTYINGGEEYERIVTTKGEALFYIPYKGKVGSNAVSTTAKVCGKSYGPFYRDSFTALSLNSPINVEATNNEIGQITVSWESNTNYNDASVKYEIRNATNNNLIKTVLGNEREAVISQDSYFTPGVDREVTVRTILIGSDRVSDAVSATGRVFGFNLTATTDQDEVTLSWEANSTYMPDGYIIKRNETAINGGGTINKGTSQVTDDGGVSGVYYTYTIISNDYANVTSTAIGRPKPNGTIEGYIKTPLNIAVGGVTVKAVRQNVADTIQYEYASLSSSEDGRYVIDDIYYGTDAAEFKIFPELEGHKFSPDTLTRSLNQSSTKEMNVNFTDTTSLTVSGVILQDGCPVAGISVMAVGETLPYETRTDGSYDIVVSQPGIYTIRAQKNGHGFIETYQDVEILKDTSGLNFTDTSKVLLSGYFTASCNTVIGTAHLHFFTEGACLDTTITTDNAGYYEVILPTNLYNVELLDFESLDEESLDSDDVLAYFSDTAEIDLNVIAVNDSAEYNFIYRLPPTLTATFLGETTTCDEETIILKQNETYDVVFKVEEIFDGNICHVDTGYLVVEQELETDQMLTDTIWFGENIDTLKLKIGAPNIILPHLNAFRVTAHVGKYVSDAIEEDILILGHRPREATFTTISPNIPFLVLHDPPGDRSYSFYEESSTYTNNFSINGSVEIINGAKVEIEAGIKLLKGQFIYSESKFTLGLSKSIGLTFGLNNKSSWDTELTIAKGYSTSYDNGIVGEEGDLYIGGALNIIYAVTDVIDYDYGACEVNEYQTLAMEPDGFATTFIYTESHITDVLIPSLESIKDLSPLDEKLQYDKQINVWEQVVENNHMNIENAVFEENVSFSGGAKYTSKIKKSSSFTQAISTTLTLAEHTEISTEFGESGNGAKIAAEFGVEIKTGLGGGWSSTDATTTGFTLSDDDEGDYQSVDIMTDQAYGTPAFKVVAGTSSCPWETATQPREGVQLRANKYYQTVSDPEEKAIFELQLANTSQSNEDNSYNLVFDATSNPYGAAVTIGGSAVVGNVPTPYEIPAGGSVNATVTVSKPPSSYQVNNLRFILRSSCDGSISDEVLLNVEFKTDCGNIILTPKYPQPLITSLTSSSVNFNISDYVKKNLTSIDIERRTTYGNWETVKTLTGDDIEELDTDIEVSFNYVEDDTYYVRAVANCNDGSIPSEQFEIVVDRTAPITTMLNPLDLGTLERGDIIYTLFDENIKMINSSDISIYNITTTIDVPFQYGVTFNKLILLPDHSYINDNDSISITVTNIQDKYGNSTVLTNITKSLVVERQAKMKAKKSAKAEDSGPSWTFKVPDVDAVFNNPTIDSDNDGVIDSEDNCVFKYNPMQEDMDNDGIGDLCDDDADGDSISNELDNCINIQNSNQVDSDGDGIGDDCDDDVDGDGALNSSDNCPYTSNPYQDDTDLDGIGDSCDDDIDGDGILNSLDNCPTISNASQEDEDNDGVGDICEGIVNTVHELSIQSNDISVYPNPFSEVLNLSVYSNKEITGFIKIYDIVGKNILIYKNITVVTGENTIAIKTQMLNKGLYLYEVKLKNNTYINRIVKY